MDLDESLFWEEITESVNQNQRKEKIENELSALKHNRSELGKWLKKAKEDAEKTEKNLALVPRY